MGVTYGDFIGAVRATSTAGVKSQTYGCTHPDAEWTPFRPLEQQVRSIRTKTDHSDFYAVEFVSDFVKQKIEVNEEGEWQEF